MISLLIPGFLIGMALLTYAVSWPLRFGEHSAGQLFKAVQGAIAVFALYTGANVMIENSPMMLGGA